MRFLSDALVLTFLLFFTETEASALKKILTEEKSSKYDEDRRNILATPRFEKHTAPTEHSASTAHQALDLHGYHQPPYIVKYSHQLSLAEPSDHRHPNISNSNNSISIPKGKGTRKLETKDSLKKQRLLGMKNPSVSQDDVDEIKTNLHATAKIGHPEKKYAHLSPNIAEARRICSLPFSQHSKLIQPKPFQDNQPIDFKKEYREKEALKLYEMYYPDGVPSPEFLWDHSGGSGSGS